MQRLPVAIQLALPAPQVSDITPKIARADVRLNALGVARSVPPLLRIATAQAVCAAALDTYWLGDRARAKAGLRDRPRTVKLSREARDIAASLGEIASTLNVDDASYLVGSTYAAMLPDEHRSQHGIYYTPRAVVDRLLDSAESAGVDWSRARVLDPACGGGAFIAPVARRILETLRGKDRRIAFRNIAARIRGIEIDGFAGWISQAFLDATTIEMLGASDDTLRPIEIADTLSRAHTADYDLVIGNPPYGRTTLTPFLRESYSRSLYGHANLYGVFLDIALRNLTPGGVVAYVTPTSFLGGEYFKRLRSLLVSEAPPYCVDILGQRSGVFDDVLQETALTTFRRGARPERVEINFVEVDAGGVTVSPSGKIALPVPPERPWILPRTKSAAKVAARLRKLNYRLSDWGYRVSTGPLVWNRHKERLREKNTKGTVPLIWAESVSVDGAFSFRAARRNHAPYFLVEGLDTVRISRPCVLIQRTTAKEQPRRLIAAELPSEFLARFGGVTVENHLNMVIPLIENPWVSLAALAAYLNSSVADEAFRCISGSVAVSAFELEALPLPSPAEMVKLELLVAANGTRTQIDELCREIFVGAS